MTIQNIAELNDRFRKTIFFRPLRSGKLVLTTGVGNLPNDQLKAVAFATINQSEFDEGNDPHGEHDFGVVALPNLPKCYWKIDYYASASMRYGTEDLINAYRVLTVMLADEY